MAKQPKRKKENERKKVRTNKRDNVQKWKRTFQGRQRYLVDLVD